MRAAFSIIFLCLSVLSTLRACHTSNQTTIDIAAPCETEKLKISVTSASRIVVARIIDVRPPVGFWSGQFPVVQRVLYQVEEPIKGEVRESTINVGHYVIARSPTADPEKPGLSPEKFRNGQSIILFLHEDPRKGYIDNQADNNKEVKRFLSLDPCGVLSASEENIRIIKNFL